MISFCLKNLKLVEKLLKSIARTMYDFYVTWFVSDHHDALTSNNIHFRDSSMNVIYIHANMIKLCDDIPKLTRSIVSFAVIKLFE